MAAILAVARADLCVAQSAQSTAAGGFARLELAVKQAVELDTSLDISGGRLSADGRILVWAEDSGLVQIHAGSAVTRLCPQHKLLPVAADFAADDSVIEIVDGAALRIWRADLHGGCAPEKVLWGTARIVAAVRQRDEWVMLRVDKRGNGSLVHVPMQVRRDVRVLDAAAREAATPIRAPETTVITSSAGHVWIGELLWPFTWRDHLAATPQAKSTSAFNRDSLIVGTRDSGMLSTFANLGVFRLDSGYVQVLADLKSDLRLLLLYDDDRRLRRVSVVEAALGILHTQPAKQALLAIRRTDRLELLVYGWRWTTP